MVTRAAPRPDSSMKSGAAADRGIRKIPNCVPCLDGREKALVAEAIGDGWLAVGPAIEAFEQAICRFTGAGFAVALSNGTAALHLGLLAAGVRPGDLIPVPTLTFAATANAVRYCGADPVFFDVEPDCWGIDTTQLSRFFENDCTIVDGCLTEKARGRRIGAIVPVDLYGHPTDRDALFQLAGRFGVPVVEDAAEALGAKYKGRPIGSDSKICCLSFNGNKIITGGNGGMVLTNDESIARRVRYLSTQAKDDPVEFTHGAVGYNYRMPNINAAVALGQSERLEEFIARKRQIVVDYDAHFASLEGVSMWREAQWAASSCWMAVVSVDEKRHPRAIEDLRRTLPMRGVEARPVWLPLHRQKPFSDCRSMHIELADSIYRTSLCLPCSTGLTQSDLDFVANAVIETLGSSEL
jgi:perosamine synthetase